LPEVAKELEMDPQLVEDISDFFWDYTSKAMSSMQHIRVKIPRLGSFDIRKYVLERLQEKYSKKLPANAPKEYAKFAQYMTVKTSLQNVNILLDKYNKQAQERRDHRIKRYARKYQADLEKQEQDSGRYEEYPIQDEVSGGDSSGETGNMPE
tara:strand:- start:919 stop:1374 length:456 start_codon:yes stop_codon:yes gene_type:complete